MAHTWPHVYVFGAPSAVGGAGTELWHTLRLWRQMDLPVSCIPTWQISPYWCERLQAIGCRVLPLTPEEIPSYRPLREGVAIAFCNRAFLELAPQLRRCRIPLVWVGCMNWLFSAEIRFYRRFGPMDAYVFQSRYQMRTLLPQLAPWGVSRQQAYLIRGAFFVDEFPYRYRPRLANEPLVLGRLCRASPDKFPQNFWNLVGSVARPIRLRVMGWSPQLTRRFGPPPAWAEVFPPGTMPAADFLASLHVLIAPTGKAVENWPRIGLEAISAGVPVVAPASGGWPEMLRHGETGLLFRSEEEFCSHLRLLYDDDSLRQKLAQAAHHYLLEHFANPTLLTPTWHRLFQQISSRN